MNRITQSVLREQSRIHRTRYKRFKQRIVYEATTGKRYGKRSQTHFRKKHGEEFQNCAMCGNTERLCTHHIDHNALNNHPENLQVLCRVCHARIHEIEGWKWYNYGTRIPDEGLIRFGNGGF